MTLKRVSTRPTKRNLLANHIIETMNGLPQLNNNLILLLVLVAIDVKAQKIYYFHEEVRWKKNENFKRCTRKLMETSVLEHRDHASIIGVLIQLNMCLDMEKNLSRIKLEMLFIQSVLRIIFQRLLL